MAKIIMFVGPPGAGKSSKAKEFLASTPFDTIYVNQDSQGKNGHLAQFEFALKHKLQIVIDKMNFNKEQRARYLILAKQQGYQTEIQILHVPFDTCMKRCLERQGHETIKTPEDASRAINFFFSKYERVTDDEADIVIRDYMNIAHKPPTIIFDLDGTMCNIEHRLHYLKREGKKDWKMFFKELSNDKINEWCLDIVNAFKDTHEIVLCSGRPDDHKRSTVEWLKTNDVYYNALYMRKRGDFRSDTIIKQNILDFELKPRYNIKFCVDDRASVVDMWRSNDLVCLACAKGEF